MTTATFDTGLRPQDLAGGPVSCETPWGSFALYPVGSAVVCAQSFCPHLLGPLFQGSLSGEEVTCPWHGWRFSLRDGACRERPAGDPSAVPPLARCAVELGPGGTYVLWPPDHSIAELEHPFEPSEQNAGPARTARMRSSHEPSSEASVTQIHASILDAIGNTPMVRLQQVGKETGCTFLAKCEFLNAGGSVKDRIGKRMVEEAERSGRIKPGDTLIEPTSGNTGIGMALAAAVKGYRMIITMPEKMSREKQVVLEALGAEIIRTPTEAAFDAPESHISVANQLAKILPNAHVLDQYANPDNPLAHYHGTGQEILEQTGGTFDFLVAGAGTGGTITGIAKLLREKAPHVKVVGVDPEGSLLAGPSEIASYKVEGIGYDFIPDVLDRSLIHEWVKTEDHGSFLTARKLIRQESLLCGGSSGSAMWAALQIARREGPGKTLVVILPDSVRNYMTKFMDDRWMKENGFTEQRWESDTVGNLLQRMPKRTLITASSADTLADSVMRMKEAGVSQLPVLDEGRLIGIVTESDLLGRIVEGQASLSSAIAEVMFRNVETISVNQDAHELLELFARNSVGLVVGESDQLMGIVTKMDLVDHLTSVVANA